MMEATEHLEHITNVTPGYINKSARTPTVKENFENRYLLYLRCLDSTVNLALFNKLWVIKTASRYPLRE